MDMPLFRQEFRPAPANCSFQTQMQREGCLMNLTTKKRLNDGREMPLFGLGVFLSLIHI